jgi:hypothetical protein
MAPARFQIAKSLTKSNGSIQSHPWFIGDFMQLTVSASTQSNAMINVQLSNADGFTTAIPENSWYNVLTLSVNSIFDVPTGARWSRVSTPALSNATIIFSGKP